MLRFINQFQDMPVLSLRNGQEIARLARPIINPDNLHIVAFHVAAKRLDDDRVVFIEDFREMSSAGIIIDSEDNLMELDGLVRLEKLLAINFDLNDKKVITDKKRSVGKVIDFTVNDKTYAIQKLYVRPTLIKSLTKSDRIIDRRQIVEVTDSKIIVKDTDIRVDENAKKPVLSPLPPQ